MIEAGKTTAQADQPIERGLSRVARLGRSVYTAVAWLFVGGLFVQVYFAGVGLLVDPSGIGLHETFAHILESALFVMLVAGIVGRLGRRVIGATVGAISLFSMQYFFMYAPLDLGPIALRALHPTNALALFVVGMYLARQGRRSLTS